MSFPNIPNVSPAIDVEINDVVNLLLASIAFEELGLAHIINAEAEKIQFVLGTIEGQEKTEPPTIEDLIKIDSVVESVLKTVIKEEMLLQFKLENVITISTSSTTTSTTTTTTTTTAKTCDCGIQEGSSGSGTVPEGADPRFVGGTANIQDPSICDDCGEGAFDNLAYLVTNKGTQLRLEADLSTIKVQCPDPFNPEPTPESPNTIVITGSGNVEFKVPSEPIISGTGTFTYIFNDGGNGPNADSFSMVIVSDTPELNHNSGLVSLNGNVIVTSCLVG